MTREAPRAVIGMDPHKRSVTIEVMMADESVAGGGRFSTDAAGYRSMLAYLRAWRTGSGRSRDATGSAATSRTGSSAAVSR